MIRRHSLGCDCPTCVARQLQFNRFLALVFSGLFLAGLFLVGRAGLFAWIKFF